MPRLILFALLLINGTLTCSVSLQSASAQDDDSAQDLEHVQPAEEFDEGIYQPRRISMLSWTFRALGWTYTLALSLAGLIAFALALIIVIRGGSYAGSALVFVVPIPLLVGLLGFLDGLISGYQMLATPNSAPRPWEMAEAVSTSLVTPLVGMLLMAPAYLVATGGLIFRALMGEPKVAKA
jgi:hypothetical protein